GAPDAGRGSRWRSHNERPPRARPASSLAAAGATPGSGHRPVTAHGAQARPLPRSTRRPAWQGTHLPAPPVQNVRRPGKPGTPQRGQAATMLTILPGTTMTLRTVRPSRYLAALGSA